MTESLENNTYKQRLFIKETFQTKPRHSRRKFNNPHVYYQYRIFKSITRTEMSHITPAEIIGTLSGFDAYIRGAVDSGNLAVVEKKEKEIVSHMKASFLNGMTNDASTEIFLQVMYAIDRSRSSRGFQSQLLFTWIHA
jgi:hypothetical protein